MSSSVRAIRGGEQGGLDGSLHDARACLTEARDAVDRALAEPSTSTTSVLDALAAARGAATSLRAAARRQHDLDARRGAA